jgi:tetratricopeptide (TPR) repeat protein
VAEALQHAHEHDVVHRDIKPSNIMLTGGHAVVTDFGIAKAMSEAKGNRMTQTGLVIGSPAYMSPEQSMGEPPVDGRSDIYSLGCVLYEMLTGAPPFEGSTPLELIARSAREEAPPLRDRSEGVSPQLEEAVHRAMAKVPEKRFQTAAAFAEAISAAPSIPIVEAGPDSPTTSATRPVRPRLRDTRLLQVSIAYLSASFIILEAAALFTDQLGLPAWVFPGALVILALGFPVLVVTAITQRVGVRGSLVEGREPWITWRRAIGGVVVALAVWGFVVAGYMAMRTLGIGPAAPLIARGLLEERERVILADFANHSPDSLLGGAVTEAFRVDLTQSPAIRLLPPSQMREAMVRMRREPGGPLELAAYRETAQDRAAIIGAVDRLSKQLRAKIGESLGSVRQSRPLPSVTTGSLEALELYASAMEMGRRGNRAAAIPFLERAVTLDTTFAGAYRALGIYYLNDAGNPGASQRNTEQAFRFSDRLPESERLRTRALVHSRRGRLDSAAHYYRLLLDAPSDSFIALNNLGDIYERMGRYEESLDLYRRTTRAGPNVISGYVNVASAARTLGLHELADSALTAMVERFPAGPGGAITDASNAYYAGDLARLEEITTGWAAGPISDRGGRAAGRQWLAGLAGMRGRADLALALADSASRLLMPPSPGPTRPSFHS